jgi:hypothetical protein
MVIFVGLFKQLASDYSMLKIPLFKQKRKIPWRICRQGTVLFKRLEV